MALGNALNTGQLLSISSSPTFFSITTATSVLKGSVSGQVTFNPQADAGTYNFNIPTTAGTSGQVLTSGGGGSSPMTWASISSVAVTTLTGTASQVLVNGTSGVATSGAITLTLPQSIATSSTVQFGSLGLGISPLFDLDIQKSTAGSWVSAHIKNTSASANSDAIIFLQTTNGSPYTSYTINSTTPWCAGVDAADSNKFKFSAGTAIGSGDLVTLTTTGHVGIGTNAPNVLARLQISATTAYNTLISGTQTADDGTVQAALVINPTMSPSSSGMVTYATYINPAFNAPGAGTIAGAASLWITASALGNAATISELASIKIDIGTAGGTITNGYGIYTRALAYGTNRYGGYFQAPAAGTIAIALYGDNASIGYNVTPPSSGLIVSGQTAIGTSSANSKALLTLSSTTLGFLPPVMTTTQKNAISSPPAGLVLYDSVLTDLQFYNGATWVSTIGVTALTGTSNQVAVSASTGSVTLSLTNGISIGSYQATSSPAGGIIAPGQLGIGTNAPNALTRAQITSALAYNSMFSGTQTADDGSVQATVVVNSVMAPTNSGMSTYALYSIPTFQAPAAGSIAGAACLWLSASASGNGGTITDLSTIKVDIGTAGGTITTGYGIRVRALAYGSARYGLYVENPAAGSPAVATYTANLSVGSYTTTAAPSNGIIVSGVSGFGTSSPTSGAGLSVAYALSGTTGNVLGINTIPTITSASGTVAIAASEYVLSTFVATGAITTTASIYVDAATASGSGGITNHYGLRIVAPTVAATTSYSIFADVPTGATNNFGCRINGNSSFNQGASTVAQLRITSSSANQYGIYFDGTLAYASGYLYGIFHTPTITPTASNNAHGYFLNPTFTTPASNFTNTYSLHVTTIINGTGTSTDSPSIYVAAGSVSSATVTNGYGVWISALGYGTTRYGLRVEAQSGGSTNICAYFGGPIKYGTNTTGAGTALLSTNCPAVTVAAPYTWITAISSDGSTVFLPAWK